MSDITGELIDRFNNGCPVAFTSLYRQFYPAVFFYIRKIVVDTAEAEDITAEVFVKFWNSRGRFENEKNIAVFLRIVAKNACTDWLRKSQKDKEGTDLFSYLSNSADNTDTHDDVKAEVLRLVQEEIDRLPSQLKKVFELAYIYEKSNEEIAKMLSIRNQSVRNHKTRAIKLLRLSLTGRGMLVLLPFYLKLVKS